MKLSFWRAESNASLGHCFTHPAAISCNFMSQSMVYDVYDIFDDKQCKKPYISMLWKAEDTCLKVWGCDRLWHTSDRESHLLHHHFYLAWISSIRLNRLFTWANLNRPVGCPALWDLPNLKKVVSKCLSTEKLSQLVRTFRGKIDRSIPIVRRATTPVSKVRKHTSQWLNALIKS